MKTIAVLGLCAVLLLSAPAPAQDAGRAPDARQPAVTDLSDLPAEDLPRVQRVVADEIEHRDRVARIRRLRELAAERNDAQRLARLDELERREVQVHENNLERSRRVLSTRGWRGTQDFLRRGGQLRARTAGVAPERERLQNQKVQREREANQQHRQDRRAAAAQPARPPARAPRPRSPR